MSARSSQITRTLLAAGARATARSGFGLASAPTRRAVFAAEWRHAFEHLGGAFIKLGQMISVRPDEFGDELAGEMERLRDRVKPAFFEGLIPVIEQGLGAPVGELFDSINPVPIATASVAQVHAAVLAAPYKPVWGEELPAGAEIVVKVIRPGAADALRSDVAEARRLASTWLMRRLLRGVDITAILDEFAESLERELDLRVEGRVADRFAFDFRHDPKIVVPRIVWTRSSSQVLTMERMYGWRLSELDDAELAGVDAHGLAVHGATAFMRQVMLYGRYHADLHPSNLFVTPDSRIAYLDFGIVGHLTDAERGQIAQVLAGFVYRDADRALRYSEQLGVIVPPDKVAKVRRELGELLDATMGGGSTDFRHFGFGFLGLLRRNGIAIPGGYGLLVKSLATVEGVARRLYPDIDIMEVARPFVTRMIGDSIGSPVALQERLPAAWRAAMRELLA
ncbi:MAG TPA: AarF/UbiB family protein [Coriobacteriia bacterium]|nr:AarF/UbiB family protein [Coriobacteriia bacterium]